MEDVLGRVSASTRIRSVRHRQADVFRCFGYGGHGYDEKTVLELKDIL
jgi:hypothetical protein